TARREAIDRRERRRAARIRAAELVHLGQVCRILLRLAPPGLELVERRDQRLGNVTSAVGAVEARRGHARAAATNARTRSASLIPGSTSRLELASTAQGRIVLTTSTTFSGPSPPASMTRPSASAARARWPG